MLKGQLAPAPAIRAASSAGRELLQAEWAQRADDDHDARDDEFSSCGQLDPSAGEGKSAREGRRGEEEEEEEEGFHRGGMEKWTLKKQKQRSRI